MVIPKMVTIAEAAKLSKELKIGVSKNHIRALCLQGKIPYCKIGVKTLINWDGLLVYLDNPSDIQKPSTPRIRTVSE